ncbi:MAG: hypothetical protein MK074_08150 [Phycisphaerales bacterium]|nr:hypothetical protein [Phycisphaerales bacterium]
MSTGPLNPNASRPSVFSAWWPLALSWLMMGLELPAIAAVISRLPQGEAMLAAFGGVVFPLGLLIEAPIIMMLAASTAQARDAIAWHRLNRWMHITSAALTALFALIALTPLFDLVVGTMLEVPDTLHDAVRLGMLWLLPWTWAIADRRTRQGLLIRHNRKIAVAQGTGIRLLATGTALTVLALMDASGIVVACGALSVGVLTEAAWARWAARHIVRDILPAATDPSAARSLGKLVVFYLPLALTPMLVLLAQPLGTAGMTRMPEAIASMAVWAPLNGLVFLTRSSGMAFNEVVIAHHHEAQWPAALRRFGHGMGALWSCALACISVPALGLLWFGTVQGLDPALCELGSSALWLAIPIPWLTFVQSLYQGQLVAAGRTGAVTIAVGLYLGLTGLVIAAGVLHGGFSGLVVVVTATTAGNGLQALWLWHRARLLGTQAG